MIKQFHEKKKITDEGYEFANLSLETFIPEAKKLVEEMKGDKFKLAELSNTHP